MNKFDRIKANADFIQDVNSDVKQTQTITTKGQKQLTLEPNTLRNNFAKRFLLSGGDIFMLSRILGHSSVTVTEQAYLDVTMTDIRKSYFKFSPLENMKK